MTHPSTTQGVTRRRVLELGARGALMLPLIDLSQIATAEAAARWPSKRLDLAQARSVDPGQFLSERQLRAWDIELDALGLRPTGSSAERTYVDALASRLERAGVQQLHFDSVPFRRWTPSKWSLAVVAGPGTGPKRVAAYVPYSGSLTPGGVTAPLVAVDPTQPLRAGSLAGKVALYDVPVINITLGVFEALAYKTYDPHHLAPPTTPYVRAWYNNMPPALDNLQAAKAAAAIGILDLGPDAAQGLYTPYDGLIRAIPGIYVDRVVGAQLRQVAASGGKVRVELGAHVANANGRNLLGIIPGASKELVAINCHTDGTNGLEDNGPLAIVAIAQYLARIPRHLLPRTILVLLTTGHFAGGIGARTFISDHRHDLVSQIAAAVTIEHLGAHEWLPNAAGELHATGNPEPGAIFGAPNRALLDAAAAAVAQAQAAPTFMIPPLYRNPHGADNYAAWPGEGSYLWKWSSTSGGVPNANYITGPTYLLNGGIKTTNKIDFTRMRGEAIAFTQMLLNLSRIAPRTLSRIDIPG
jgi:hypothetical protein